MNGYGLLAKLISLGVVALVAVIVAAKGHDAAFIFHAYVIAAVALGLYHLLFAELLLRSRFGLRRR